MSARRVSLYKVGILPENANPVGKRGTRCNWSRMPGRMWWTTDCPLLEEERQCRWLEGQEHEVKDQKKR